MTHRKRKTANGYRYTFRSSRFVIPAEELITAVRESRRLHQQLVDDLMREVERRKGLLVSRLPGGNLSAKEAIDCEGRHKNERAMGCRC